jgi:uncharacterized membrane protein
MMFNVPLNDALAAVAAVVGANLRRRYLSDWTMWNHVRHGRGAFRCRVLTVAPCLQARAPAAT